MESNDMNSVQSVIKLEPEDLLHVVSLPSSAVARGDFIADSDEQESLILVTSLLSSLIKLLIYFAVSFLLIPYFFWHLHELCVDVIKGTQTRADN